MIAYESLPENWACGHMSDGSCSIAEEKKCADDRLLSAEGEQRLYAMQKIQFCKHVAKYLRGIGISVYDEMMAPVIENKPIDLFRLYREVISAGGCDAVTASNNWRKIFERMTGVNVPDASYRLKLLYKKNLYLYEQQFFFEIDYLRGISDAAPYTRPICFSRAPSNKRMADDFRPERRKRIRSEPPPKIPQKDSISVG